MNTTTAPADDVLNCGWTGATCHNLAAPQDRLCMTHRKLVESTAQAARAEQVQR